VVTSLDEVIVRTLPPSVAVPQCGQKRLPAGTRARHWTQAMNADYR
jgi:hypothetical protein